MRRVLLACFLSSIPIGALEAQKACVVVNPAPGPSPGTGALVTSWFAFPVQYRTAMTVTALDFHMSTNRRFKKDGNGRVAIYSSSAGKPGRILASAPFVVSQWVRGWYGAKFAQPVVLRPATQYFIAFRNLDALVPSLATRGTVTPYFWGPPRFRTWQGPRRGLRFSYRVYCGSHTGRWVTYGTAKAGAGAILPRLRGLGHPNTTNTIHLQLSRAVGARPALLVLGSRVAIRIPPGTLYATPIVSLSSVVSGSGNGAGHWTIDVVVPNDARLRGVSVGTQAWVLDAAATAGLSHSNGLQFVLGH